MLDRLLATAGERGGCYVVLLDPDRFSAAENATLAGRAADAGCDAFFVGGSLAVHDRTSETARLVKQETGRPVILFPGNVSFVTPEADAILFLSLLSGRNPQFLIGEHVVAAPLIRETGLETIATAYLLVDGGSVTSVEFMSATRPLPREKTGIAVAHALAAQYLGFELIFFDAGSGASKPVPPELIGAVAENTDLPIVAGGGIRTPEAASAAIGAGARFVVTGDVVEKGASDELMREIADAVHGG
ncbi:MAG: geranylgeranylglyceryl/heptaprenylglyceryl phosphate synthase [Candidatus Eisenbacteria bacterium]|nr:geranylgeranylglyceryl/heptaprenylglyceryl phosphate synthase [Candidatus Eisenbacteria bacterium]